MNPITFATEFTHFFIKEHLPARCRVLEVGCGLGDLALQLQADGHPIVAIDSSLKAAETARSRGVPAQHCDFLTFRDELFDAILFTRSLHHIYPIEKAMEHTLSLLKPHGIVLVEDFDWQAVNEQTASWLYRLANLLCTSSILAPSELTKLGDANPLAYWVNDHRHDPPLNTGLEMLNAAKKLFKNCKTTKLSYLFRYFVRDLPANEQGRALAKQICNWEEELIHNGSIQPTGLRIIATR